MKLYPITVKTVANKATSTDLVDVWQSAGLPKDTEYYVVYFNYTDQHYDVAIATTFENENTPIIIDDLTWYEKFSTKAERLGETWDTIYRKGKQGLLRRAFTVDFEQHQSDGKVEVFVSIVAHC